MKPTRGRSATCRTGVGRVLRGPAAVAHRPLRRRPRARQRRRPRRSYRRVAREPLPRRDGAVLQRPGRRGGRRRGVPAAADALARAQRARRRRQGVRPGDAHAAPERGHQRVRRRGAAVPDLSLATRQDRTQGSFVVQMHLHQGPYVHGGRHVARRQQGTKRDAAPGEAAEKCCPQRS